MTATTPHAGLNPPRLEGGLLDAARCHEHTAHRERQRREYYVRHIPGHMASATGTQSGSAARLQRSPWRRERPTEGADDPCGALYACPHLLSPIRNLRDLAFSAALRPTRCPGEAHAWQPLGPQPGGSMD